MRKLASGSLIVALVVVCAASAGGQLNLLAAIGERIRLFRVSEPLLLLLLGMCLIVSASALPPRLRRKFRATNSGSRQNEIPISQRNRVPSAEINRASIDVPPQSGPSTHNRSSAAGSGR